MTVPRMEELTRYWNDNPPLHVMVAAYLGIGTAKKDSGNLEELMNMFPECERHD